MPADNVNLVLVPGLLCTDALFAPQAQALADLAVISVGDHRSDMTLGEIAARILAKAPAKFALAGLSMGGYVAFEIIRQAPQRVQRLALIDTSARADTPQQIERRTALIDMAESGRFAEAYGPLIPNFVHPRLRSDEAVMATLDAMAQDTGAQAFVRQQRAIMARRDSRPELGSISCPVDVIVGAQDELTPPEVAREIAAGIPAARLHELPVCGHLATLEQPESVNAIMRDWLTRTI